MRIYPEAAVETRETVGGDGLLVHIDEAVELTLAGAALLCRLGVVSEASTSIVERVHEHQRQSTSKTARRHVTCKMQRLSKCRL